MTSSLVWRPAAVADVLAAVGVPAGGRRIVAVDGRSSGGKTALAARLHAAVGGSAVVHTDDLAWHHSVLGWDGLLAEHVLGPVRRGDPVGYRPPGWVARDRPGSVTVPAGVRALFVEGVGSGRRALAPHLDAVIWVHSDRDRIERRNAERVAAGEISPAGYADWLAEEEPFVAAERTWERAAVVVRGDRPELEITSGPALAGHPYP